MVALGGEFHAFWVSWAQKKFAPGKTWNQKTAGFLGILSPSWQSGTAKQGECDAGALGAAHKKQAGKPRLYKKQEEADGYCKAVVP